MEQIHFAIVGVGWRAEFFLRVAAAMPERFIVDGAVVRDADKGAAVEARWGIATYRNLDDLLSHCAPRFVVAAVPWAAMPGLIVDLVERGVPVLSETPPAPDLAGLCALWDQVGQSGLVQVSEQYVYQPLHAARLAVARSGKLGTISQAQVSAAHGYHGISLLRHFLDVDMDDVTLRARTFVSPLVAGPDRNGPPAEEAIRDSQQTMAWLDYGDKLGVFDFCGDQYFSWVRGQRLLVRGERGEIINETVRYLSDYATPITFDLKREVAGANGNLEGLYLKGIIAGENWAYTNPTTPAPLTDDEIAVATVLLGMAESCDGGPGVYPLAQACQDHYLTLLMNEAIQSGEIVSSETQPWMA